MIKTAFKALFTACMLWQTSVALRCFETLDNNNVVMTGNPRWQYCVFLQVYNSTSGAFQSPSFNGVGAEEEEADALNAYKAVFDLSISVKNFASYRVKSNCVLEEYRSVTPPSDKPIVETLLRCFCTTDLCNRGASIEGFLANMAGQRVTPDEKLRVMRF